LSNGTSNYVQMGVRQRNVFQSDISPGFHYALYTAIYSNIFNDRKQQLRVGGHRLEGVVVAQLPDLYHTSECILIRSLL